MRHLNIDLLKSKIEIRMADDIANGRVGGANLIVNQNGKRVYTGIFSDERIGVNVKANTIYRIASMTKPIVAASVMIMYECGLVGLDDPVSKYIPGFAEMNIGKLDENDNPTVIGRADKQITIRHLLTHSSGLGTNLVGYKEGDLMPDECRKVLGKSVDYYTRTVLAFEPGMGQGYSPLMGFDVLARIVEIVSGMTFAEFIRKEICDPLGMPDTVFEPVDEQWDRFIPMHHRAEDGTPSSEVTDRGHIFGTIPVTNYCGGGGLASTAEDYSKFAEMLLWGKGILSQDTLKEMQTPQLPPEIMGGDQIWGLGMRVITKESYRDLPVGAFGWSGAFGTHFWVDPVNKVTAVYMKNSAYDGGAGAKTARNFEQDVMESFEPEA